MQLDRNNYYSAEANRHYMSVSQFKGFLPSYGGCESQAMAIIQGVYQPRTTDAFIEGHYLHAWNEGTLEEFKVNNSELYSSRGATAGQLKSNFIHCEEMIRVLERDPFVTKALAGQKEVIMTAELFSIPWKVMLDSYQPQIGIFADLKALKEIDGKWWNKEAQVYENFIQHYGYDIQMAMYAETEKVANGRDQWFFPHMVVITKQDPPDHDILYFDYDDIERALAIVSRHIERVKAVKSGQEEPVRCEKCEYCRITKRITRIKHSSEFALY